MVHTIVLREEIFAAHGAPVVFHVLVHFVMLHELGLGDEFPLANLALVLPVLVEARIVFRVVHFLVHIIVRFVFQHFSAEFARHRLTLAFVLMVYQRGSCAVFVVARGAGPFTISVLFYVAKWVVFSWAWFSQYDRFHDNFLPEDQKILLANLFKLDDTGVNLLKMSLEFLIGRKKGSAMRTRVDLN